MKSFMLMALLIAQINSVQSEPWEQELNQWKTERVSSLKKPHGWLSLIGMEWLHQGENSIGSAEDNSIKLPHGPAHLGSFYLNKENISFKPSTDSTIRVNDKKVSEQIPVKMDSSGDPTVFKVDSFLFYVIERGKPALRIKDSKAQTRTNFKGIDYFPATDKFRISAEFIPYQPAKELEIINVLGLLSKDKALGKLKFMIDSKPYQLDVMDGGKEDFYIIFADRTSGRTTYGPGRFLYVQKPKTGNLTTIDFNKAYNPPCAFTDYSTCPLPPPQNRLRVFIEAGEKKYH